MSKPSPRTRPPSAPSKAVPALSFTRAFRQALFRSAATKPGRPCWGLSSPGTLFFKPLSPALGVLVVAAACALPAPAAIVYSGLRGITIPDNFDGVYLDIPDGMMSGSEFPGWDLNFIFGGTGIGNSPGLQPVRSGTGALDSIVNLGSGALVDQFSLYAPAGSYGGSENHLDASNSPGSGSDGQFAVGQEGCLGFAATIGGQIRYGWMRVILTNNAPGSGIIDWAYDDSGATITTGTTSGLSHFTKSDPGLITLTQAHTYGGLTTISNGTLELTGNARPGTTDGTATSGTLVTGSGILRLNGVTIGNEHLTFSSTAKLESSSSNTWTGPVILNPAAASPPAEAAVTVLDIQSGITTLSGSISGPGGFEKLGAGNLILSTPATYTGATILSGGLLTTASADNTLPATTALTLNGGTWNTGGHSQTAASLSLTSSSVIDMGGGDATLTTTILTFGSINPDNNWAGILQIWNWSGIPISGGGQDQILVQSGFLNGLTLAQIRFYPDQGLTLLGDGAALTSAGELVPIPEPASAALIICLGILTVTHLRLRSSPDRAVRC